MCRALFLSILGISLCVAEVHAQDVVPVPSSKSSVQQPGQVNAVPAQPKAPSPSRQPMQKYIPETPAVKYPDSMKSEEFRVYEKGMQDRLDSLIQAIELHKAKWSTLSPENKAEVLSSLQTAEGNRSVARTKVKALGYNPPAHWLTRKNGVDKAIQNLEDSVEVLKSKLSKITP